MHGKILGISGSPVRDGNMETFLRAILENAPQQGLEHEIVNLSCLEIRDCIHCNFCLSRQKPGRYCSIMDDGQEVFEKIEAADIIVLASPVYFMRTSALMAALIDRLRVFVFGNLARGRLKNKIGVSAAVSWLRNGGVETTHLSHLYAFLTLEMIPASVHSGVSVLGASVVASRYGSGDFDPSIRLGALEDQAGFESAAAVMQRAVELLQLIRGDKS